MLICRVLGPTEVAAGAGPVDLGGPLPRRLVTALVLAEGRPVDDERLAQAVWGDDRPPRIAASLQAYVSRLRRVLGRDALPRTAAGYRLAGHTTDAAEFTAAVAAARDAASVRAFDAALALWRGEPYADLGDLPDVAPAREQLADLRSVAVEERLAARLATGDAPGATTELQAAVRDEPYRERRWELLIVGLYRCGRQGEALAALRRIRALLADELGVDPGPQLQQLERRLLAQDPGLLLRGPTGTTRPLTTFLGRDRELAVLGELLGRHRLVTLTGPGGAGKTRLAVEYAADRPHWLVRLADTADPGDLDAAVAGPLGIRSPEALTTAVRDRTGLLILDNCEHLVADVAALVLRLLAAAPGLRVLATGREPLGVDGEHLLPVAPLPAADAVALLVDRITAVRPGWTPGAGETGDLHRLAAALDGIPLALELAAARTRVLNLGEVVALLGDRFPALGAVPRGALTPHRTLEATIAWSVDLLAPADRRLLLRLWPFEGGFPLEAVTALGFDLEALSALVTRSVVSAGTTAGPTRYRMLELLRAYCRDHDPDPAASRAAHAAWVRELVERSAPELRGDRSGRAIRLLNRELPNLRTALAHDLATAPASAVRTAGLLEWFWFRGGHVADGLRLLGRALAAAPDAPATDRARAWSASALLHFIGGDVGVAESCLRRAIELLEPPGSPERAVLRAQASYYESLLCSVLGRFAPARDHALASMALARAAGEDWIVPAGEMALGTALNGLGEIAPARRLLARVAADALALGQAWTAGMTELQLARALLDPGAAEPAAALAALRRALSMFDAEDDIGNVLSCLHTGALAVAVAGRPDDAAALRDAVHRHGRRRGLKVGATDPAGSARLAAALDIGHTAACTAAAGGAGSAGGADCVCVRTAKRREEDTPELTVPQMIALLGAGQD